MELKEAMGYVQAVADNCNDAPRYQRALQTVLNYAEASYEEQNRLLGEIAGLREALDAEHSNSENLKQELADERYRHDRYVNYSMERDDMIDALQAKLASMREGCPNGRVECLLVM